MREFSSHETHRLHKEPGSRSHPVIESWSVFVMSADQDGLASTNMSLLPLPMKSFGLGQFLVAVVLHADLHFSGLSIIVHTKFDGDLAKTASSCRLRHSQKHEKAPGLPAVHQHLNQG